MEDFKPIFIVGVGRSGTSLLQSMLNAHKDISFPPETHFIRYYLIKKNKFNNVKDKLLEDENLKKLNIDLIELVNNSSTLRDFYVSLLKKYINLKDKRFVGDKDPKNVESLKVIKENFPNSTIIHIYRDPRAVIASRIKAKWSMNRPFWQQLLAYKTQLTYGRDVGGRLFENYLEIKYEDLLSHPERELSKITKKLGLNFDSGMLEYYKKADEVIVGEEKDWKKNLYRPIMNENIEKWKNELSATQIKTIEVVLEKEMKTLGYENLSNLSQFQKMCNFHIKLFFELMSIVYKAQLN